MFGLSLPQATGFKMKPLQNNQTIYFRDPKYELLKPKRQFDRQLIFNKANPSNAQDKFTIAKPKPLQPITATWRAKTNTFNKINKRRYFQPMFAITPKMPKQKQLTNAQLSMIANEQDPMRKFFLFQSFQQMFEDSFRLSLKLDEKLEENEKNSLQTAANRLQQRYIELNNGNRLNSTSQNKIIQEYFTEVKPIYDNWKTKNGSDFDPMKALEAGLVRFMPAVINYPTEAPSASATPEQIQMTIDAEKAKEQARLQALVAAQKAAEQTSSSLTPAGSKASPSSSSLGSTSSPASPASPATPAPSLAPSLAPSAPVTPVTSTVSDPLNDQFKKLTQAQEDGNEEKVQEEMKKFYDLMVKQTDGKVMTQFSALPDFKSAFDIFTESENLRITQQMIDAGFKQPTAHNVSSKDSSRRSSISSTVSSMSNSSEDVDNEKTADETPTEIGTVITEETLMKQMPALIQGMTSKTESRFAHLPQKYQSNVSLKLLNKIYEHYAIKETKNNRPVYEMRDMDNINKSEFGSDKHTAQEKILKYPDSRIYKALQEMQFAAFLFPQQSNGWEGIWNMVKKNAGAPFQEQYKERQSTLKTSAKKTKKPKIPIAQPQPQPGQGQGRKLKNTNQFKNVKDAKKRRQHLMNILNSL